MGAGEQAAKSLFETRGQLLSAFRAADGKPTPELKAS
jgi:hypothetical protein